MALQFGVSWHCTLLLWGCICFSPQKGYNIAHGYSLNGDELCHHEGMLGTQTSNQFDSGASLNANQGSVSPSDEMQAMRPQNFVSLQREPEHHENNEEFSSVTSLSDDMVQNKPDSEHDVPSAPPVQKYEHDGLGYRHPFGLLVKEHTQDKTMEGTSFQTIKDLKRFIETMKRSFLMPRRDFGKQFQTAKETMENEMASNAQNIKGEPDMGCSSNCVKEETAHDEASENKVWSKATNTAFEQREQGTNYQMPSENPSVPEPVDSTKSLLYTSVYDNQDTGPGSALYPWHHLAATEHVSGNRGSFDIGDISGKNPTIVTSAHVRNEDVQSTSHKLSEEMPSGSFSGEDLSVFGNVTASPVNPPNSPFQYFSNYLSKTPNVMPLISKNIQQPKYTGYRKPSGDLEHGDDLQSKELGRGTPANVLSTPMPPSLNSYAHSLYIDSPRRQHYIPEYLPKHRERPAQSFPAYRPTFNKESDYTLTPHRHVSSGSSSFDCPSSQSSIGHVGVQTSRPHDSLNEAFNRKQPVRMFTVKPSSSLHGSSRHEGYLRHQTVRPSHPSTLPAHAKDEKSDLSKQNLVFVTRAPKQTADHNLIPISSSFESTHSGISSWAGDGDTNLNSQTNFAPTSASERAFQRLVGNEGVSSNLGTSDARNPHGSLSTPLRGGLPINGGYMSANGVGLRQTLRQPNKVLKRPANVNKEPGIITYRPLEPLSASKVSDPTLSDVFYRNSGNTKWLFPKTGPKVSPPVVDTHAVKSRSGYVRRKLFIKDPLFTILAG